jgi:FKBP-type peptidyl-prolyl cis-trans isomerase FkpA
MRRLFLLLACALPLLAAACDSSPTEATVEDTDFAPALGVDLGAMTRLDGGLYYRDLTVGTGAVVQAGQMITAKYKGWLSNGTLFTDAQSPFRVGVGGLIRGWDEGIPGMHVGGKRQLVIPPSMGYGAAGRAPNIPGNAVLVFEVEVLSAS